MIKIYLFNNEIIIEIFDELSLNELFFSLKFYLNAQQGFVCLDQEKQNKIISFNKNYHSNINN